MTSIGISPDSKLIDLAPERVDSSTRMVASTWLLVQSRSAKAEPESVILTSSGPDSFSLWANDICEAPCPTTSDIAVDETSSQPFSVMISSIASTPVASLEPRLSTLAVMRNCSSGCGMVGSVRTAPSRKARSMPCGLWMTGNVSDCSLSVSSFSSIVSAGSRETMITLFPTVVGFQYSTISTMSPLSILGSTSSSLRAPSS